MKEQTVLADVPAAVAKSCAQYLEQFFNKDFRIAYPIGAQNPSVIVIAEEAEVSTRTLKQYAIWAQGFVNGFTVARGF